jgi:hypothetical protein
MQFSTKILLVLMYPLLLLARLLNLVSGRERLRLHDVSGGGSFWIDRRVQPNAISYFSEHSCSEGGAEASAARPITRLLCLIARLYKPPREVAVGIYKSSPEREQGIPDQVYTLW